jgi:D-glycero-D-manno-heptose 1,7-bisphosphate phosphatase
MRKALFLDRDGVINYQNIGEYVCCISDFSLIPDIIDIIHKFQEKRYLIIIITNQGGCIDKWFCKLTDVKKVHDYMKRLLIAFDIKIDKIYICPHHPGVHKCKCRKPSPYLINQAIEYFNIDPKKSFYIGDSKIDELSAKNAGIGNIIINETNNPKLPNNLKI